MADLFSGTTALITGASRGIGAAFADLLAERGAALALVARDRAALEVVAGRARRRGGRVEVLPADLADPAAPASIEREVAARGMVVDHLINNAGIGVNGRFADAAAERHLRVIDVNLRAPTELAARFLPGMIARKRGGVLNVASTAAFQGLVWLPVYSATKAYLLVWNEAVWVGLRGTGVRSCCLCPGPVDTAWFEANQASFRPPRGVAQTPEAVARAGLRGYERDRSHVISGFPFRLLAWSTRLAPRWLAARMAAGFGKPEARAKD